MAKAAAQQTAGEGAAIAQPGALLDALAARVGSDREDRLVCALLASVGHVHDLLAALRPTPAEWRAVIGFLTEVGHAADARRQEWVLLADVIGASTLVEDLHAPRPLGATPNTLAGPFYRADAPDLEEGADISRDGIGERLVVAGRVLALDHQPVPGACVEVWHANSFGFYENQQPDQQPEFNLRGRFITDEDGRFRFRTVRPQGYALPGDGPVGRMMARAGVRLERPAHLHFRVTGQGFETLTTHIYDRTDPAIGRDALFGVKPELLGDIRPIDTPDGPAHALDVCLVLVRAEDAGPHVLQSNRKKEA